MSGFTEYGRNSCCLDFLIYVLLSNFYNHKSIFTSRKPLLAYLSNNTFHTWWCQNITCFYLFFYHFCSRGMFISRNCVTVQLLYLFQQNLVKIMLIFNRICYKLKVWDLKGMSINQQGGLNKKILIAVKKKSPRLFVRAFNHISCSLNHWWCCWGFFLLMSDYFSTNELSRSCYWLQFGKRSMENGPIPRAKSQDISSSVASIQTDILQLLEELHPQALWLQRSAVVAAAGCAPYNASTSGAKSFRLYE